MGRREWAQVLMARAPSAPLYGSPEWEALPDGPEKVAAVVRAAEAWVVEGERLPEQVRVDVEAIQRAYKDGVDDEFHRRADEHQARWSTLATLPTPFAGQRPPRPLEEIGADYIKRLRGEVA